VGLRRTGKRRAAQSAAGSSSKSDKAGRRIWRTCRFERMEPRTLLAADFPTIEVGAVYFEDGSGQDEVGDLIEVTFLGGAPGTELTQLGFNTDKRDDGQLSDGDPFFDVDKTDPGAFAIGKLVILDHTGFEVLDAQVADGGTLLEFTLAGFEAGEKLVFSIDVDEGGFPEPNAVVEGKEFEGSRLAATFAAPHYFDASGGDMFRDDFDDEFAGSLLGLPTHLPNDDYDPPSAYMPDRAEPGPVYTAGAIAALEQVPLPASLSGTVFEDLDLDNVRESGEPGIGSVDLTLLALDGSTYVPTGMTTTDAAGNYRFDDLLPGTYRVVETQPDGLFSVGATPGTVGGQTRGSADGPDAITGVELLGGEDSIHNDFAEARPASLSGHVYHDADNDGVMDPGEQGIGEATIEVERLGTDIWGVSVVRTQTAPDGSWSVGGLRPGDYFVVEEQPDGYLDGLDAPGNAGGSAQNPGDRIDGIRLASGQAGEDYDFGEIVPASISGRVHADENLNDLFDPGEQLLADVTIRLLDDTGQTIATTLTDADGEYLFDGLRPGTYAVEEEQPAGYFDGPDHVGSEGGRIELPDGLAGIVLASGTDAVRYDFCEYPPGSISGRVHVDLNLNCQLDPGEETLAGVTIRLLDAGGSVLQTTLTDANGEYVFRGLGQGVYTVEEVQPAGYFDGPDVVGSSGGQVAPPDGLAQIELPPATDAVRYDFCEYPPASISGRVHVDLNGNSLFDPGEETLANVTIRLLNEQGQVLETTLTNTAGEYLFDGLAPGVYGVEEVQPAGYFDGADRVGSEGGALLAPDSIIDVDLGPGVAGVAYDFCEVPPAALSGYVYADDDRDGQFDPGEDPIANVTVELLDDAGLPFGRTTTTDSAGFYRFDGLEPGTYGVAETQPDGFFDGLDTPGNVGGTAHNPGDRITAVRLKPGVEGQEYNFGELRPASISGRVHAELNGDCIPDPNEPRLANVTIYLLDPSGERIAETVTDENGEYVFGGLEPGTYGVEEIQPPEYLQGRTHAGSAGGDVAGDLILHVELDPGEDAVEYNFCELTPSRISGYVFQDGPAIRVGYGETPPDPATVRDGVFTPDDTPIPGVVLQLGDASGVPLLGADGQPITAVTDQSGYYEFTMLEYGQYTVIEVHPEQYVDGIDTPGTTGGVAINPHQNVDPGVLRQLAVDPKDDAIVQIMLGIGESSEGNNFSEVVYSQEPIIIPPPHPPSPPFVPPPVQVPGGAPLVGVAFPLHVPVRVPVIPGGSAGPAGYTWHLSVLNAGQPRRDGAGSLASSRARVHFFDPATWTGPDMGQSQWIVGQSGTSRRKLRFGVPGAMPVVGDFNGDGIDEVGVYLDGVWLIDLDGNGEWDEGDLWAELGSEEDLPVVGDWDGDGKDDIGIFGHEWVGDWHAVGEEPGLPDLANPPSGKLKNPPPPVDLAAIGRRTTQPGAEGTLRSDVIDHVFRYGSGDDKPVAGDWNGDGVSNVGVFRDGVWFLDVDGNGRWSFDDVTVNFGREDDVPVVGDFNADGIDDLGVYRRGTWYLDTNGNRRLDAHDQVFQLGGPHDKPAVGDFNGDGVDEIAVYQDEPGAEAAAAVVEGGSEAPAAE